MQSTFLLVRGATHSRRADGVLPGFTSIGGSVGAGGRNAARDVLAVQTALNAISPDAAGPLPALAQDGVVGPKTIAAIRAVQTAWTQHVDGRVDPGRRTIRVLNRLAGAANAVTGPQRPVVVSNLVASKVPPPASPVTSPATTPAEWIRAKTRLEFAQTVSMPTVAVAVVAALQLLAKAQQHIGQLKPAQPPTGAALRSEERLAFLFVAKHFRLHESDPTASLVATQQVSASYLRVMEAFRTRTTSTPAGPRFDRLFSLPEVPSKLIGQTDVAYCGTLSGLQNPNLQFPDGDFSDGIYLMPGFDRMLHMGMSVLLHELAHLSGGISAQSAIVDINSPTQALFDAQPRDQRLINVSCYEFFGTEVLLGTSFTASAYPGNTWSLRLPLSTGGGRLVAPLLPTTGPDPLSFPAGFA